MYLQTKENKMSTKISYFIPNMMRAEARHMEDLGFTCDPMQHGAGLGCLVSEAGLNKLIELLKPLDVKTAPSKLFKGVTCVQLIGCQDTQSLPARSMYCSASSDRFFVADSVATAQTNSLDTLSNVLAQVQKLQSQANLTEPERIERHHLQAAVQSKQTALESATQRLKSAGRICEETAARIEAIADISDSLGAEMAALPAELQGQCSGVTEHLTGLSTKLKELAESCFNDQTAARQIVNEKRADLTSAKQALGAYIAKQRVSAEDTLINADAALSEAERVSSVQE